MNEKLSNYTDQRARDAASNVEPPYDEESWKRMEALLDDKKRRPVIFWFFLSGIILLIGVFIIVKSGTFTSVNEKEPQKNTALAKTETSENSAEPFINKNSISEISITDETQADIPVKNDTSSNNKPSSNLSNNKISSSDHITKLKDENIKDYSTEYPRSSKNKTAKDLDERSVSVAKKSNKKNTKGRLSVNISNSEIQEDQTLTSVENTSMNNEAPFTVTLTQKEIVDSSSIVSGNKILTDEFIRKDTVHNDSIKPDDKSKSTNHKMRKWFVMAGGGIESSNVKFMSFKNAVFVPRYGVGVGYKINKRWIIQTGFYVSSKKYLAGPDDYKASSGSYWSNVTIIKADANCKVYDIPVSLRYNLRTSEKSNTFLTAGLHSFIMKSEKYNYLYTDNNYTYEKSYSYTGNKGYFGILSLSGGFEKNLNNHFSLIAEPYLTVPLKGVGDGHVKLFSTGFETFIKYSF